MIIRPIRQGRASNGPPQYSYISDLISWRTAQRDLIEVRALAPTRTRQTRVTPSNALTTALPAQTVGSGEYEREVKVTWAGVPCARRRQYPPWLSVSIATLSLPAFALAALANELDIGVALVGRGQCCRRSLCRAVMVFDLLCEVLAHKRTHTSVGRYVQLYIGDVA